MKVIIYLFAVFFSFHVLHAQEEIETKPPPVTRILFVFDASQSMYGRWQSDMKITIARKLLTNLLDSLVSVENIELALRVYGHQYPFPPQVCNDTRLMVPFGKNNIPDIKQKLKDLSPKGTTPIAFALEQAGYDFPDCGNCRNIIVLITDGIEECDGDPCAVSLSLQKKGLVLKPFIIGIGRNFAEAFDCVGTYFDASSEQEFSRALNVVISQALNSTSAQVNLLDEYGKPTETDINMTFYDNFSGLPKYNFIHTLNNKGIPDTLTIDPLLAYDIVVHTIPAQRKDSVTLTAGKHTVIPVETPQGSLYLKLESRDKMIRELKCIVRQDGRHETLNIQTFGQTEKYITGVYDLEVLCLPRVIIQDVEIKQSHTTTVEIPVPGIAVIDKNVNGFGSLYTFRDNELIWLYNFRDNIQQRETLVLQPGTYKAVFRSKYSKKSAFTVEKIFAIESGKSINVYLYR
ncbi:MAG: VWA domain-containing protein [Bacteroidales bacterium]|nr:VWA domain-containing protein [Bacteroidales bacterium]